MIFFARIINKWVRISVVFNNMRTLKFKPQLLLPSIKFPAVSDYCRACSTHMEGAVSQHGGRIS